MPCGALRSGSWPRLLPVDRPGVETEVVESKDATGKVTRTETRKDVVHAQI